MMVRPRFREYNGRRVCCCCVSWFSDSFFSSRSTCKSYFLYRYGPRRHALVAPPRPISIPTAHTHIYYTILYTYFSNYVRTTVHNMHTYTCEHMSCTNHTVTIPRCTGYVCIHIMYTSWLTRFNGFTYLQRGRVIHIGTLRHYYHYREITIFEPANSIALSGRARGDAARPPKENIRIVIYNI